MGTSLLFVYFFTLASGDTLEGIEDAQYPHGAKIYMIGECLSEAKRVEKALNQSFNSGKGNKVFKSVRVTCDLEKNYEQFK